MKIVCTCDKKILFEVKGADKKMLEMVISVGQKMVMVKCGSCSRSIPLNLVTLSLPTPDGDRKYACVVKGCDGVIVHVDADGENFWGCGECGSVWASEKDVIASGAKRG